MQFTINALLSMQKALLQRREQLNEVKNQSTSQTLFLDSEAKATRKIEPTYDIKKLDKKISEINKTLFSIDVKIKESNAVTKVDVDMDFDTLMSEIE